jgi:hypothetical protein
LEYLIKLLKWLKKLVTPPRAYSWQTLILLSLFSYVMSFLATGLVRNWLSTWGWIFLIWGVGWATNEQPIYIGPFCLSPWITGALVCIFIFGSWSDGLPPLALIWWPPVSAVIAAMPHFLEKGLKLRLPPPRVRQQLVILFGSHLLISCWFQFYFVAQNLLYQYPSLLADDFSQSAFVVKLKTQPPTTPRGAIILNLMEPHILQDLDNQPWSQVEQWFLEQQKQIQAVRKQVQKELPKAEEDLWWLFDSKEFPSASGYNLKMWALWQGPRSKPENYHIEKLCQINQVYPQPDTDTGTTPEFDEVQPTSIAIAEVKCTPASSPRWERNQDNRIAPKSRAEI